MDAPQKPIRSNISCVDPHNEPKLLSKITINADGGDDAL